MKRDKKTVIPDLRTEEPKQTLPFAREPSKLFRVNDGYFDQLEKDILERRDVKKAPTRRYIQISVAMAAVLASALLITRIILHESVSTTKTDSTTIALDKVPSDLDIRMAIVGDEIFEQAIQSDSVNVEYGSREWLVSELSEIPDSTLVDYLMLQNTSLTEMTISMTN